jgi:hypothetical protein
MPLFCKGKKSGNGRDPLPASHPRALGAQQIATRLPRDLAPDRVAVIGAVTSAWNLDALAGEDMRRRFVEGGCAG